MYQNSSPCYQHPLVDHTGYPFSPPSQHPRLDYKFDNSFSPTMGLAFRHSPCPTAPPTPIFSSECQLSSMPASSSSNTSSKRLSQNFLHQCSLPPPLSPLSQHLSVDSDEPSLLTTFNPTSTTETYYTSLAPTTPAHPTPAPTINLIDHHGQLHTLLLHLELNFNTHHTTWNMSPLTSTQLSLCILHQATHRLLSPLSQLTPLLLSVLTTRQLFPLHLLPHPPQLSSLCRQNQHISSLFLLPCSSMWNISRI